MGAGICNFDGNIEMRECQRMAKRNEFGSFVTRLYSSNPRDLHGITFRPAIFPEQLYCRWRHLDKSFSSSRADRFILGGDVDHASAPLLVDMGQRILVG